MAKSVSACQNKNTQKPATFSQSEIEAARLLIQLSSADSGTRYDEDHHSSNNSYSYSVQWKPQQKSKADSGAHVSLSSSAAIEDVLAEAEEDERFRRRNNRYRYIEDLYNSTKPLGHVPEVKEKKMKFTK